MPLNASSPKYLHILQNIALIIIAAIFIPILTFIAVASSVISPFCRISKHISHTRKCRANSSPDFQPRTILVTGVGMAKGVTIARSFYRAGHKVIGADFESYYVPVCGRFSQCLFRFYRVTKPRPGPEGARRYIEDLLNIVKKEGVELWVSCSGVASAIEDGEGKEVIEKLTKCKAIQFSVDITTLLHEKDNFIENTERLELNVPDTYSIKSNAEALSLLYPEVPKMDGKRFIMKSTGVDDAIRADMTKLPLSTQSTTARHIASLRPSRSRPFVLQQFISGPEFCTHSIAIRGQIKAFTACPSSELLMHYHAMDSGSPLFKAFLRYTQSYAAKMGKEFTGHFSIDFLVDENVVNGTETEMEDMVKKIYPIECNPRAHTAAVLFADTSEEIARAYLSLLCEAGLEKETRSSDDVESIVMPGFNTPGYYWVGHDLVTRILIPILCFVLGKVSVKEVARNWVEFFEHVLFWKDGTYEIWDPWPMWWLYVVYWPGMFWLSILEGNWWSRCNVSTAKLFRCS